MNQSNKNHFEIVLTAPGKIILFGEHSVVYGKKAVAATLGLYTKLHLIENNSNNITLQFPSIGLEEIFPINIVQEYFSSRKADSKLDVLFTNEIFQNFYSQHGKKCLTESQRYSLVTFFHSFGCINGPCNGFDLRVETALPVSSGAGSSASFSVIVSTAMLLLEYIRCNRISQFIIRNESNDGVIKITDELKELISKTAFSCECLFHGTPSGIDNNIILHGSALEFIKGSDGNKMALIKCGTIRVLLVDTKVSRSTKKQVEIFRKWKETFPSIIQHVLDVMENIAEDGIRILCDLKVNPNEPFERESRLASLINLNHSLLRSVEVSHEALEQVCSIARKHGLSAKLTGAGGGGLSFVYLPSGTSSETIKDLEKELKLSGFDVNEVILGGPGLQIKSMTF